jgi:predicted outer membrane protein
MRVHLLLCIALVTGCSDDDNDNDNNNDTGSDVENRASDQGNARGQTLAGQAQGEFQGASNNDAIAKAADIIATIDAGEIAQASFVLSKTSNADVRELASEIQADHQANTEMLQSLMQDRGIAPADNAVSRALEAEANAGLAQLQADAAANVDFDYVQMQVMMHQEALVIVGSVRDLVPSSGDFRDFLSDTRATIQEHRQHAGSVLRDLR